MSLANDILAIHEGVIEAFIVEERSGEHAVIDHATKDNSVHPITLNAKHDQLVLPELILGVAAQFRRGLFPPKVVGVSYGDIGVLFCHLTDKQVLVVTAYSENLSRVMELTEEYVQRFAETGRDVSSNRIKSATEAEAVVQQYLANRRESAGAYISVDDVAYAEFGNRWVVNGSFGTKRYSVEVEARTGSIMKFTSTPEPGSTVQASGLQPRLTLSWLAFWLAGFAALALLVYSVYAFYVK
jgi:hypothetical protein